jgi:uncharacterized protein (DUF362 family)
VGVGMTSVAITQQDDIGLSINEALDALEVEPVVRGKHVAIKPNETWASEEDLTAVTQGDSLRALIQYVKRFEPASITVTGGAGAAETEDVFRLAGMMDAIEAEGVRFFDHNRPPFTTVDLAYGPQPSIQVNPRILEFESLIVLSNLKMHRSATVTLAIKNIAMSFPAADYYGHPRGNEQHQHHFFDDLHGFLVGMAQRFPIDLAVTVGHPAMVATGPIGGHTVETGLTFASRDAVAADSAAAAVLGFEPQAVRHIFEAIKLGLGDGDIESMDYPCLSLDEAYAIFTEKVYGKRLSFSDV